MTKQTPYAAAGIPADRRPMLRMQVTAACQVDGCDWRCTRLSGEGEVPSVGADFVAH